MAKIVSVLNPTASAWIFGWIVATLAHSASAHPGHAGHEHFQQPAAAATPQAATASNPRIPSAERILYIRAGYSDTPLNISDSLFLSRAQTINATAEDFWNFNSYGRITEFDADFTDFLTLQTSSSSLSRDALGNLTDPFEIRDDFVNAAIGAGHDVGSYDQVVLLFPSVAGFTAGGLGTPGTVWLPGENPFDGGLIHELGHAFGLGHASTLEAGSQTLLSRQPDGLFGEHREGRDGLFMLGSENGVRLSGPGVDGRRAPVNLAQRYQAGFVEEELINRVAEDGVFRIHAFDREDISGDVAQGRSLATAFMFGGQEWFITFAPGLADLWSDFNGQGFAEGVIVHQVEGSITRSIDFTPGSQGFGNSEDFVDTRDGALVVGQSFTFPDGTLTLSPLQTGVEDGVPFIDVSIVLPEPTLLPNNVLLQVDLQRDAGVRATEPNFVPLEFTDAVTPGLTASASEPRSGVSITIEATGNGGTLAGRSGTDSDRGGELPGLSEQDLHGDLISVRNGNGGLSITLEGLEPGVLTTLTAFHNEAHGANPGFTTVGATVTPSILGGATLVGEPEIGEHTNLSRPGTATFSGPYDDSDLVPSIIQFIPTGSTVELLLQSGAVNNFLPVSGIVVTAVPEPTSAVILAAAFVCGAAGTRWRKRCGEGCSA